MKRCTVILNSLDLLNFKKYTEKSFKFDEGLVGIIGKNGSGKSTIFEAILFALYGELKTKGAKDFIRNSTVSEREAVSVTLEFDLSNIQDAICDVKLINLTTIQSIDINTADIKNIPEEFLKWLEATEKELLSAYSELFDKVNQALVDSAEMTNKEVALTDDEGIKSMKHYIFASRSGKDISQMIWKAIKPKEETV